MCPVFARTMWRYGHSRAYRTVLIDTGHLGQTFCLVATALGLAPFTTMAFSEAKLEELLGLDGVERMPDLCRRRRHAGSPIDTDCDTGFVVPIGVIGG